MKKRTIDESKLSIEIDKFDVAISSDTVLRLCHKIFAGEEIYDLRLWRRDIKGNLYPRKGQGLCLREQFWLMAMKLLSEHIRDSRLPVTNG